VSIINFTVNYDLFASQTDSSDSGIDADIVPLIGTVKFSPLTTDNRPVLAPTYSPRPAGFKLQAFTGYVDVDGRLKSERSGAIGVRLWANDPVLKLTSLNYKVEFDLRTPLGEKVKVDPGYFTAPSTDVSVQLAEVLQATGTVSTSTLLPQGPKGDRGYGFAGLTAALDGTAVQGLVETATGTTTVGSPISVSVAYNSTVTHGTNASYARPPVSVAVIWIGSVQPTNAVNGDVWMDTSGTAPTIGTTTLSALNQSNPVSIQLVVTAGTTPIVWSVSSGTLPAGLTLSSDGTLTGTPSATGSYSFTARATNGFGAATQTYSGTVGNKVAPTITTSGLGGTLKAGTAYTQPFSATGSIPLAWSISAGTLPSGLSIDSTSGLLSGTPTTTGSYSFTVRATNDAGYNDKALTGTITGSAPTVTTTTLTALVQGLAFSQQLITSGSATITFAVTAGTLPAGLSVNSSSGLMSGTPSSSGSYNFTVTATNSFGTDAKQYTGTISSGTPTITTTSLSTIYRNVATSQTIFFTGAYSGTWSVQSGTLPTGLSLNTSSGVISGTATTVQTSTFTIRVTNSYGYADQAFTVSVLESQTAIVQTSLNTIRATVAFSQTLTATGLTPITYSVASGSLPAGLSLNSSTGVISGTPSTAAAYSFTIRASNSLGNGDQLFTGNVLAAVNPVTFNAIGAGLSSSSVGGTKTFSSTAASGADVFLVVAISTSVTISSVTYGGTTMSAVSPAVGWNGSTNYGGMYVYRLAGGGTGSSVTVSMTFSAPVFFEAQVISYTGVGSIGTPVTATGSSKSPSSGSVTCATNSVLLNFLGIGYGNNQNPLGSLSGGTNRHVSNNSQTNVAVAISESNTSTSTTFAGTSGGSSTSAYWASWTVQLNPSA